MEEHEKSTFNYLPPILTFYRSNQTNSVSHKEGGSELFGVFEKK